MDVDQPEVVGIRVIVKRLEDKGDTLQALLFSPDDWVDGRNIRKYPEY